MAIFFEWLDPFFMKRALLALLLAAPLFGLLGSTVIANRMAFFSDALGHAAFAGIALALFFGLPIPRLISTLLFSIFFAVVITFVRLRSRAGSDTVIGVFAAISSALGILILSHIGNFSRYAHVLTGDILTISHGDIWALGIVFLLVVIIWGLQVNHSFLCQIDEGLARSYGVHPFWPALVFAIVLACVVSVAVSWIGVLLLNALLVLPAASSRMLATNLRSYHWLSIIIAMISAVMGLATSYYLNVNTTATIVLFCGLFYGLSLGYAQLRSRKS